MLSRLLGDSEWEISPRTANDIDCQGHSLILWMQKQRSDHAVDSRN